MIIIVFLVDFYVALRAWYFSSRQISGRFIQCRDASILRTGSNIAIPTSLTCANLFQDKSRTCKLFLGRFKPIIIENRKG